ncbi:MAG: DUF1819 family protein [Candidatus Obscuribacterales bacterium]|nr:DUF1819 family protein [Candidatus Obscuribacterales bacterium]
MESLIDKPSLVGKAGRYSSALTTGTLLHTESVRIAELYLETEDWRKVRASAVMENLLQARTVSSLKKLCAEVISRLRLLTRSELVLLIKGTRHEQLQLLWIALAKRYRLVFEFGAEVLSEKVLRLDLQFTPHNYDQFFSEKAEWHEELASLSPGTQAKLRQNLIKILHETELLTMDNRINLILVSRKLFEGMSRDSKCYVKAFAFMQVEK